jgi:hypothetical protein
MLAVRFLRFLFLSFLIFLSLFLSTLVDVSRLSIECDTALKHGLSPDYTTLCAQQVNKHIKRLLSPLNEVESQREEDYRVSSWWLHCAPHCSSSAAVIATFPVLQSVPVPNGTLPPIKSLKIFVLLQVVMRPIWIFFHRALINVNSQYGPRIMGIVTGWRQTTEDFESDTLKM